ncbi:TD and POZ domain-containing protein 3 [Argiope bruennichi]|uniref:TD and POZ domain-containing protein 3 n=1 Tax=Argiope bruennichi TaxID=94029 RepID=A0A8T0EEL1_ARGBR|nr:TD and POZ domain-containing protein 3 [Argiope bruennichi]
MAAALQRKCFSIDWRIENYKFLSEFDELYCQSPWFTVENLDGSKFCLGLYPSSQTSKTQMALCIERDINRFSAKEMILYFIFSLSSDQCPSLRFEKSFSDVFLGSSRSLLHLHKAEIYEKKEGKFILPDTMTIHCKMWQGQGLSEDGECVLITEPQVKHISVVGVVENCSELRYGMMKAIRIRSAPEETYFFSLSFGLTQEGTIFVQISPKDFKRMRVCKCVFYLLDRTGIEKECGKGKLILNIDGPVSGRRIPLQCSERSSTPLDGKYLSKDCLFLQCEIAFSSGKYESKFTKIKYAAELSKSNSETPVAQNQLASDRTPESSVTQIDTEVLQEENHHALTVQDDLLAALSDGLLSDTKLQTATETFPAHKIILSSRSPVFKAMFTNNMKETNNNCVQIEDLDADTVRRLLLFLYSDNL